MKSVLPVLSFLLVIGGGAFVFAQESAPTVPEDTLTIDLFGDRPPYPLPAEIIEDEPKATREIVALGRKLFFDPILSIDKKIACASCHDPAHAFAAPVRYSPGVNGKKTLRNSPTIFNRGFSAVQFFDGRAKTLQEQVLMPIQDQNEMGMTIEGAIERLRGDATYADLFKAAFEAPADRTALARALAAFVGRLYLGRSPVDLFRAADTRHLSEKEKTGLWIYESKGRCWKCHVGPNFSDEKFHNTGVGAIDLKPEPGRETVTKNAADRGRFKTPTLRGLTFTAPYMHDGSIETLEEVVAFYRKGGKKNENLDSLIEPIDLTDDEAAALVAFLGALSRTVPEDVAKK